MIIKKNISGVTFDVVNYLLLLLFTCSVLFPFLYLLLTSLSPEYLIASDNVFKLQEIILSNWQNVLTNSIIWTALKNTVIVTLGGTLWNLFLSTTFAYPLSRNDLPGRKFWTTVLLITMFFTGGLIPTYLLYANLGLVDNLLAMIVGGAAVWNILILRNFFMAIPKELVECSKIDGASDLLIFGKIILPLSLPALATVTLWCLVAYWNTWVPSLIYISDPDKEVLQIVLRRLIYLQDPDAMRNITDVSANLNPMKGTLFDQTKSSPEGIVAAATLFSTIPILITYPFLQKFFMKGILMGSVKG